MAIKKQPTTWYPRVHNQDISYTHGMETGNLDLATIIPTMFYDEAISPSTISTNPENASFAEVDSMNCMPDSRIDKINCEVQFSLTKGALETDKLHMVRCAFMPIHVSFEDISAKDELSGLTIGTVLELETESTDRQAMPLYNTVKMLEKYAGSATLDALQDGLTTNQILEGVTFGTNVFYDALHYHTTSMKLKNCQSGLKWFTLTRQNPFRKFRLNIHPKTKRMNEYTFGGILTHVPAGSSHNQYHLTTDTTDIPHVAVTVRTRYNEWNENFNFKKV